MTRSKEFIQKNKKRLTAGAAFYNPDTSLMPIEKYESSKLKMILIFPSPFTVKTVSSTASAINDFFVEHCPDVFLDFAYMPEGEDIKLYNDNLMPYAIGNITHLDASHFDVVGFSISVLSEIVTAPVMLKSFERCDKHISLFWSDRKNKSIKDHPIIYAGGITAVCGDVMFGKVGDKESYLDFEYLGSVDKTDVLLRRLIEAKETGYVTRLQEDHDIPGYLHKDIENFESKLKVDTVQDYIESLFDLSMIYQPQAYEVKYNRYHRIISNTKVNPKAQDFVTPFYPHVLAEELGIGRTIIPGNGDNCGVSQVQVSEGCSSGGACSFCAEGNYCGGHVEKTRDEILRESLESKKYSAAYKFKPFSFNVNYVTDYKGLLYDWIQMYPKVTFINMRMEELGRDTDALHMMKLVGSNRISAPMEGLSPRIQNNLLNKCLSAESLNNFMDDMVHAKMTDIKCGGIFTAYEEDQDFQWICDFVDKFKKRAALEGGNFPFRLKCCATDDALTPVPGRGLLRQSLLSEGEVVGYENSNIIATKPQGISEVLEIETNFGNFVRVTPNHPILTKYTGKGVKEEHYTEAKDLKVGQTVYSRIGTETYGSIQKFHGFTLDSDFAAVLGWYMGEGYINQHDNYKTHGYVFSDREIELKESVWSWYVNHGFNPRTHNMRSAHCTAFRVHNAEFTRDLLKEFGHTAYGKKISQCILSSPRDVQCTFLAWWFAADGTVTNDSRRSMSNSRIRLYSVNRQVLSDAQVMLFNMGIISILSGHKTKCGGKDFYTYQLEIKSTSVSLFADLIKIPGYKGSIIKVNNHRGSHCFKSNGVIKNTIKRIVRIPDEETYGIEVVNHSYLTNGLLSHNTPLVHYSLTPIEYIERKSALKSFEGEHWLTDEWYEKFREHQVFFKVNGFRYSTFLEQSLVDMGRFLTPIIHEFFVNTLAPVYSLRSIATDEFLAFLKKQVNPFIGMTDLTDEQKEEEKKYMFGWFGDRHPEHYISPNHRVHIELMGSYIPRARRLVEAKQKGDIFSNEPDIRCLKTFEGAKVRCYSSCIKDNPLKIYNDVSLDENGNLHGEFRNLNGCERCQTPAQKRWRLTRPTPQTKDSDDIIAAPRIPQVQKLRFVLNRSREYDVLNPNNTAHTFITKFLQLSDNLLHSYHSVNVHNMFWQCDPGIDYFCAGFQIVDTFWSKDVLIEVRSLIPEVNKMLKSTQVVSVKEELKDEKIKVDDFNIFYFESEIQSPYFESATHNYNGEIKVVTGQMGEVSTIQDKILKAPIFSTKAGKTVGCFAIPAKYNPAMFISSFLSNVKKSSLHQVNELTQFTCLSTVRETQSVCKHCGAEHSLVSIATGTQLPFGLQCLCKVLLSKKLK